MITESFNLWRFWLLRALIYFQLKHQKTKFGILWEPLSLLIVTLSLAMMWSIILAEKTLSDYYPYILSGFAIWTLIRSFVVNGVNTFQKNGKSISNSPRSLLVFVFEDTAIGLISFISVFPVVILILLILGQLSIAGILWFLFGLLLIVVTAVGFTLTVGILSYFVGDVKEFVIAIMRLAFLLTPIIWRKERLGEYVDYLWFNPFYSYLSICRNGLLSEPQEPLALAIATVITTIIIILGSISITKHSENIRYKAFEN